MVSGAASLPESDPPHALIASRAVAVSARAELRGEFFMAETLATV